MFEDAQSRTSSAEHQLHTEPTFSAFYTPDTDFALLMLPGYF